MKMGEKGFSLIGVVVAITVAAIIAAGAGMTAAQIFKGTDRNENHVKAVRQAQNLGRFFSRDALTADTITPGDNPGTGEDEFISVYWKDWESGDTHDICYLWFDDVDSLKQIKRSQIIHDKDGALTSNITSMIAYSISTANLSQQDNTWVLKVETCAGEKTVLREYKVTKRLS